MVILKKDQEQVNYCPDIEIVVWKYFCWRIINHSDVGEGHEKRTKTPTTFFVT
jgi:hypothetical protein